MMNETPTGFRYEVLGQRREFLELTRLDVVKRLYQEDLSIVESTYQMWEDGKTTPDADKLPTLAKVLKCKVHEFYA